MNNTYKISQPIWLNLNNNRTDWDCQIFPNQGHLQITGEDIIFKLFNGQSKKINCSKEYLFNNFWNCLIKL